MEIGLLVKLKILLNYNLLKISHAKIKKPTKMNKKLKIYRCEFEGLYPVGNCLVLAAYNQEQAEEMARKTISHTTDIVVNELALKEPQIIEYLSGDY